MVGMLESVHSSVSENTTRNRVLKNRGFERFFNITVVRPSMRFLETGRKRGLKNRGFQRFFIITVVRPFIRFFETAQNRGLKNRGFVRFQRNE